MSSVEKHRQQFYDDLKKEDTDYVKTRSKKATVDLYRRRKSDDDPWQHCFYFIDDESKSLSNKFSIRFDTSENLIGSCQIGKFISDCSGITDEEINRCKAALRREARSRNLPDLSSKPHDLRLLYSEHCEKFPENFKKQRKLHGEIVCSMMNFEVSLKDGLEALKPLSEISVTAETFEAATANIASMKCIMQDFQIRADSVRENLCKVLEKFEMYQELDEKMDRDVFNFLANFFSNFLLPRSMRKKGNTRL